VASRGFLLGKFLPPHTGHRYLCDFAQAYCDELTILVCSIDREPIPGELRFEWMREMFPSARVLHCWEDLPQEPADHPDFWAIWRDVMRRYHPEPIDLVFASEAYGLRLAQEARAEFVPVDIDREVQPISGTAIRANPIENWDFIAPPARDWFTRVICLHGPESTGKTTLARQLTKHYGTCLAPEYGRTYTEQFGTDCDRDDLVNIARGQAAAICAARKCARGLVITDTDPLLTAVWSDMLVGERHPDLQAMRPVSDLYLLMDIDLPWVDDGTRYFPDQATRDRFSDVCEAELVGRKVNYVKISGDREQRLARAVAAIDALPR